MMKPATSSTYGRLSAPSLAMNCDRVIGLMMLYAVIARKEYANIRKPVRASSFRTSTTGERRRWSMPPSLSDAETEVNCRYSMLSRLRRFFDVRPGEGLPVLLTFLYIAVVVAAYLLAKPIRNGLFLQPVRSLLAGLRLRRGADRAVAVRAALHPRRRAHRVARCVTAATLLFFASTSSSSGTRSVTTRSRCCPACSTSG